VIPEGGRVGNKNMAGEERMLGEKSLR
jgi:hypothetical protein